MNHETHQLCNNKVEIANINLFYEQLLDLIVYVIILSFNLENQINM